jgi:hypothetical protein
MPDTLLSTCKGFFTTSEMLGLLPQDLSNNQTLVGATLNRRLLQERRHRINSRGNSSSTALS